MYNDYKSGNPRRWFEELALGIEGKLELKMEVQT